MDWNSLVSLAFYQINISRNHPNVECLDKHLLPVFPNHQYLGVHAMLVCVPVSVTGTREGKPLGGSQSVIQSNGTLTIVFGGASLGTKIILTRQISFSFMLPFIENKPTDKQTNKQKNNKGSLLGRWSFTSVENWTKPNSNFSWTADVSKDLPLSQWFQLLGTWGVKLLEWENVLYQKSQ